MLCVCVGDVMDIAFSVFCLQCDAWSCRCSCMGSMSVSSWRCCMFVLCASCGSSQCCVLHDSQYVNAGRGCNRRPYRRVMSVSFCLPHPVAVSAFMICRGLCACTEMLWMCVLYVSFGSKVRHRIFGCVAMGSAFFVYC